MPFCNGVEEGSVMLQLRKWSELLFQLNPSEFREAFISPSRELLLLLSYEWEAHLFPLTSKRPLDFFTDKNCTDKLNFEGLRDLPSSLFSSPGPVKTSQLDSATISSIDTSLLQCPVISNVKSLAWGHFGDLYSQHEDSCFQELLLVSCNRDIVVHIFYNPSKSRESLPSSKNEAIQGTWVEWGPHGRRLEKLSPTNSNDPARGSTKNRIGGADQSKHWTGAAGPTCSQDENLMQKKWLQTFLIEPDVLRTGDNSLHFPKRSSLPSCANVASFSIYNIVLMFMGFISWNDSLCKTDDLAVLQYHSSGYHVRPCSLPESSKTNVNCGTEVEISCKCSKVFGGSSHRLIGLVFTCVDSSYDSSERRENTKIFVVVVMVYHWGLQWLCCIDLQSPCRDQGVTTEWTDFQFLDNLLACLNSSGLIFIFDAKAGDIIAKVHALSSYGIYSKINDLNKQASEVVEIPEKSYVNVKKYFRTLVISSYSMLIAAIDEYGIIYVVSVEEYLMAAHKSVQRIYCFEDVLFGWKVAGSEIGNQKVLPNPLTTSGFSSRKGEGYQHTQCSGCKLNSCLNSSALPLLVNCKCHRTSILRKVLMPIDGQRKDASYCFSFLGLFCLVRNSSESRHQVVHTCLHVSSMMDGGDVLQDELLQKFPYFRKEFSGDAIGCHFNGSLYSVTEDGLFIVVPSATLSLDDQSVESIRYWQPKSAHAVGHGRNYIEESRLNQLWNPWQVKIIDRVILYEGPEEAEAICLENGWDLKVARIRRMQLALHYLKYEEIERSLDKLADVDLAEEGILRLIFASAYQISCLPHGDDGGTLLTRFLSLAARFASKMIRSYGLMEYEKNNDDWCDDHGTRHLHQDVPADKPHSLRKLKEMALFLETIRNIQDRLGLKGSDSEQVENDSLLSDLNSSLDEPSLPHELANVASMVSPDSSLVANVVLVDKSNDLDLLPLVVDGEKSTEFLINSNRNLSLPRKAISYENPKDMVMRWAVDNFDIKTIVRDALMFDRLPLAVLQLHLQHINELVGGGESYDIFATIRNIGRSVVYDMFLEGDTELAVATLQRLGEDVEFSLRQLLFGTTRRSVRWRTAEQTKSLRYLKLNELKPLERLAEIERSYPQSSFWITYNKKNAETIRSCENDVSRSPTCLQLSNDLIIECGDVDGAVLVPWVDISEHPVVPEANEDTVIFGYWACAAVWSNAWDERTIDRILLDQRDLLEISVPWESQLEYHISHNEWKEVERLLDNIPTDLLSEGSLKISIERPHMDEDATCNEKIIDNASLICSSEEFDPIFLEIPDIRIFELSVYAVSSSWLKMLIEQRFASDSIFLKDYWGGISEILPLLARSGRIFRRSIESLEASNVSLDTHFCQIDRNFHDATSDAFHKLIVHYCIQYFLPNLMELYLDHHELLFDKNSIFPLLEITGDCQWVNWLLLTGVQGCGYNASFANARCIFPENIVQSSDLSVMNTKEILLTVDDMAEGGGELAALATLMYAPLPIQRCLCRGSVSRHGSDSFQCTLENLKHGLQKFPTLWNTLVAFSTGEDPYSSLSNTGANNVSFQSASTDYVIWRDAIFSSAGEDTSLIQMLPCWFSKSIRRLIKIFVQGPPRWELLSSEDSLRFGRSAEHNSHEAGGTSALSWEVAIQRSIEELYPSFQERKIGIEHHLHRGRPLAAFSVLLSLRAQELKSRHSHKLAGGGLTLGPASFQSDIHTILEPLTLNERSKISSVVPLAILHFEDSVLVSSCIFLLELCGLPANILRLDVMVLQRISSYYMSVKSNSSYGHVSPKARFNSIPTEDCIVSLARALSDNFLQHQHLYSFEQNDASVEAMKFPPWNLMDVLQHLEKASLPSTSDGNTCGSWLSNGIGDGSELRSQQKASSDHWHLVTLFCQTHRLPLSTKYLSVLAKDNDWVGFLLEAQISKFPLDTVIKVAGKEFRDPRLKMHILTVLKSMQSLRHMSASKGSEPAGNADEIVFTGSGDTNPAELFGLLSECERKKNPGECLLLRARDLRWSLLALVASCFPDVSLVSCLTVWLEISVARESSSIKINDIYSKIANNVGAAVEATNRLPVCNRILQFHYNRKNPKRRRREADSVGDATKDKSFVDTVSLSSVGTYFSADVNDKSVGRSGVAVQSSNLRNSEEKLESLSNMISVLCEQQLFLPLLRAFEMFLPSCSLLPFIRSLQAFSHTRLAEASAHLKAFSSRMKESYIHINLKDEHLSPMWISTTAVKAAKAMLNTCPSIYEKRSLLELLSSVDFHDGGSSASYFLRLYWKIDLSEPLFRKGNDLPIGAENLDDTSLLEALEKSGQWEDAHNWAKQLDSGNAPWKPFGHHVTEMQAEAMVSEWKEFLWDVPEERAAIWSHCQTLFLHQSFPALRAGKFFLKHAETIEKDIPARELHEVLLLSLQWLSGFISQCDPVFPLHLLRDIETRVWLLAVESEAQYETERDFTVVGSPMKTVSGNNSSIIEQTANIISKMDKHMNIRMMTSGRSGTRDSSQSHTLPLVSDLNTVFSSNTKSRRRSKVTQSLRRDNAENTSNKEDYSTQLQSYKVNVDKLNSVQTQDNNDNFKADAALSGWEEAIKPAQLERAVLSLLEFGQIQAARQLQQKLSPSDVPSELFIVDLALKLASIPSSSSTEISICMMDSDTRAIIESHIPLSDDQVIDQVQILELLAMKCSEGCGHGLCKRIIAVLLSAKALCIPFSEAFERQPIELLRLLTLKAQECLDEARLLVQTHVMPPASIACVLAESFLKGLLAAHRGGYMDSPKEEGPAPLLWRTSDFVKWAELCPSESEVGHELTRLVMRNQEIPHACEVELLILAHHFYKSSSCLDGVDVLVTLAANRVDSYVYEEDFSCLARLVTGVGNFHALNFILNILVENDQLELLLHKFSAVEVGSDRTESVRGFRMAVLTALKHFDPNDLDAIAMVYNHFDMKHESSSLLESRSDLSLERWNKRKNKDQVNEDLLEAMGYLIEAAEVYSTIDAGQKTHKACARAELISLQVRIPDFCWLDLSDTNARRLLSEQSRFQEALIVAEAYGLNKPTEWAPVLWNLMLRSDLIEQFVLEFVTVLPLQSSMLIELARYYRNEVVARGERSHFSWLSPGGMSSEWIKHLGKSFRSLLRKTRDFRVRMQLATTATGFSDVVKSCAKVLDKVPDNSGPLILRRGHGGAYLPLM